MKIFIDTNVLISSAVFPNSTPYKAFYKAVTEPNTAYICDQNIDALKRIFSKNFSNKAHALDTFLSIIMTSVTIVKVPAEEVEAERKIRDEKDRPIFRAAVMTGADVILTGDKDFLEAGIVVPRIMSPSEFISK